MVKKEEGQSSTMYYLVELCAVLRCQLEAMNHFLRMISIHVKDGRSNSLCNCGTIRGRTSIHRISGEADLVVDNDVNSSSNLNKERCF